MIMKSELENIGEEKAIVVHLNLLLNVLSEILRKTMINLEQDGRFAGRQ
jgi:hypothetical protein